MSKPTVVFLAGGSNTRFFPLNTDANKASIKILGRHLINRTLENLEQNGFDHVVVVQSVRDSKSGSLKKAIEKEQRNLKIDYVVQQEPKGMGDATLSAKAFLKDRFLIVSPDLIGAGDLGTKLLSAGSECAVRAVPTTEPWLYGVLELEGDRVISIEEKPEKGTEKSNQRISACYLLNQKFLNILDALPEAQYNFETALEQLFKEETVKAIFEDDPRDSLKYPWHLFDFQDVLFSQSKSSQADSAKVSGTAIIDDSSGPVIIEEGATIKDFAKIIGPAYIGKNVLIGDYGFVRSSSIEEDSVIGANAEIVRSIIMANSTTHYSYIADSIIGSNNQIGAGLVTANKRLDRETVKTIVVDKKVDTGREALGVITGDGAKIGISTSTMPGVLIGANSMIHPGQVIKKNVEHDQTVT